MSAGSRPLTAFGRGAKEITMKRLAQPVSKDDADNGAIEHGALLAILGQIGGTLNTQF